MGGHFQRHLLKRRLGAGSATYGRHVRARLAGAVRDARYELPPIVVRSAYRVCNANPHAHGAPDEPCL